MKKRNRRNFAKVPPGNASNSIQDSGKGMEMLKKVNLLALLLNFEK